MKTFAFISKITAFLIILLQVFKTVGEEEK
jgi:hypothetical protein